MGEAGRSGSEAGDEYARGHKAGYQVGYRAKRAEEVDHRSCREREASLEDSVRTGEEEILRLRGEILGMTNTMMIMRERE
jgi:hypothetical protein